MVIASVVPVLMEVIGVVALTEANVAVGLTVHSAVAAHLVAEVVALVAVVAVQAAAEEDMAAAAVVADNKE